MNNITKIVAVGSAVVVAGSSAHNHIKKTRAAKARREEVRVIFSDFMINTTAIRLAQKSAERIVLERGINDIEAVRDVFDTEVEFHKIALRNK